MPTINVTDRDGKTHVIQAPSDDPLMWALRDADLPVDAICGGSASCGTCHVYVEENWMAKLGPRNEAEVDMLSGLNAYTEAASRLSCQMIVTDEFEGLEIALAPSEL